MLLWSRYRGRRDKMVSLLSFRGFWLDVLCGYGENSRGRVRGDNSARDGSATEALMCLC